MARTEQLRTMNHAHKILESKLVQLGGAGLRRLRIPVRLFEELLLQRRRIERDLLARAAGQRGAIDDPAWHLALGRITALAHLEGHAQIADALTRLEQLLTGRVPARCLVDPVGDLSR